MALEDELQVFVQEVWARFIELLEAPLGNNDMLWAAIPLLLATVFMSLYFGRYKKEELGWNTAFGNTMVFVFVAINLIKEIYMKGGSWASVLDSTLYVMLCFGLVGSGMLLMLITYFHLLPKKLAFFLFSAPPINVSVYVLMSIVYANVAPDRVTVAAGALFLIVIIAAMRILQFMEREIGLQDRAGEKGEDVLKMAEQVRQEMAERMEMED